MKRNIGVVGLWHLGCVISAAWAKLGNKVTAFDYDGERIDALNHGNPPVFEPGLEKAIKEELTAGHLQFTESMKDIAQCDFVFLSYDTPVLDDDGSDLTILVRSVMDVRTFMRNGAVLIVSSQTPVGSCSHLRDLLRKGNDSLDLAYSPENLRLGDAIKCYLNPERIILGTANAQTAQACTDLFHQIGAEIVQMNLESAELVKHGINAFLATGIVFSNSLAEICEIKSANIEDVVRGMKSDPRIGQRAYLSPGIGFSGGTLGRDLKVLQLVTASISEGPNLFGMIHRLNEGRKSTVVRKIVGFIGNLDQRTIGVLGLTYKPGTSTLRRSLPVEIIEMLLQQGANVRVYDPQANYSELTSKPKFLICENVMEIARDSDLLVLLTEWPEFKEYRWASLPRVMHAAKFFDARNFLNSKSMREAGFEYYSIGGR